MGTIRKKLVIYLETETEADMEEVMDCFKKRKEILPCAEIKHYRFVDVKTKIK